MTERKYDNVQLELEFQPDSTLNSGVFVRWGQEDINPTDCYALNLWDLHPDRDSRTGAIVTRGAPLSIVETNNRWNRCKIRAAGSRIQAWVNG